jgi:hypothetical protein
MIASDSNNPDFVGAFNADSRLAVQFYSKPMQNEFESEKQQRPIFETCDFVKIITPGDKLNIIDTFAREDHKTRFPLQWQAYKNRGDTNTHMIGTPITEWSRITPAQALELNGLKFFTVEAIAGASDAQLQGIGMIAGTSAYTFRDDARRFLSVAEAASKLTEADKKVADAEARIAAMQAEFQAKQAAQEARMDALLAAMEAKSQPDETEKRGPGRPAKAA